jgi:phosphoglycerol transferase
VKQILKFLLLTIAISILFFPRWLAHHFGDQVTFEQFLFHIFSGTRGLTKGMIGAEREFIYSFLLYEVVAPTLFATVLSVIFRVKWIRFKLNNYIPINPKIYLSWYYSAIFMSLLYCSFSLGAMPYFWSFFQKDQISKLYVDPADIEFTKINTKNNHPNLILIYVESLESGFRRKKVYGRNLVEPLDVLQGYSVDTFPNAPGTGWSIAGMVASQCSIPVKLFYGNGLQEKQHFLPNAICIGDVLNKYGYDQYFLTAVETSFAGMDHFYSDHGYQHLLGMTQWRQRGVSESAFNGWFGALHDDTLLGQAKKVVIEAEKSGKPYNVTLITTDNHGPEGWPSGNCAISKSRRLEDNFACNADFVAKLINDLKAQGALKNAVVVIMGDHRFMNTPAQNNLFPAPRNVYFKIITPGNQFLPSRDTMTHFDVAPSILSALGISNKESPYFGLGISLDAKLDESTYSEHLNRVMDQGILNPSLLYDSFWLPNQKKIIK